MDSRPKGTGFDSRFGEKIGERLEARNGTDDWRPVRGATEGPKIGATEGPKGLEFMLVTIAPRDVIG